jgi:hypothetical protein
VPATLDIVRAEWEEGHRRLEERRSDPTEYRRLHAQVDVLVEELRRRVGSTYTLAQLAEAYGDVDRWSRDAVEERAPAPGWPRTLSLVEGAAFYRYQRGAQDYRP